MKRRDAIRNSAFLVGCGLSAGTISTIVSGCKTEPTVTAAKSFLNSDMLGLLGDVVETIIPTTDSPGAKAAGVHYLINEMAEHFTTEEQGQLNSLMESIASSGFADKSVEDKESFLLSLDDVEGDVKPYTMLKGLTCQGYFTSEIGAKEALAYLPIPGEFIPCMPLSDVGKSWALN